MGLRVLDVVTEHGDSLAEIAHFGGAGHGRIVPAFAVLTHPVSQVGDILAKIVGPALKFLIPRAPGREDSEIVIENAQVSWRATIMRGGA